MSNEEYQVVSAFITDPKNSIFTDCRNKRAKCTLIKCKLESCPLRDKNQCVEANFFSGNCVYGYTTTSEGYTKRSKKYNKWINDMQDKYGYIPRLERASRKIEFIGDYVYLPYSHMDLCKQVRFITHNLYFNSSVQFIKKEHWTLAAIITLLNFQPQSLMGGIIKKYQEEIVPLFLQHLRERDPRMFARLVEKYPEYDVTPQILGRKAYLHTLNYPIEISTNHDKYPVLWKWDGEHIHTTSNNAYNTIWGVFDAEAVEVKIKPKIGTSVKVLDLAWVNSDTKFAD